MLEYLDQDFEVKRFKYRIGKRLHGEDSKNRLYAIVSNVKGKEGTALRISMIRDVAYMYQAESRHIHECFLED